MDNIITWEHTERALQDYGEAVAAAYKASLQRNKHVATSELLNSVRVEVIREGYGSISVALDLASYWQYVEWDTRPHWPPKGSLLNWIKAKPILPSPDSRGRIPTPEQLDFLIRRKIANEGTTGTHDLANSVEDVNKAWLRRIEDAIAQDIDEFTTAQLWVLFGAGSR